MSQITEIKQSFETITTALTSVNEFAFDVLSAINERNYSYPLVLLKVPELETVNDYRIGRTIYNIEFFCFDTFNSNEGDLIDVKHSNLRIIANDIISALTINPNLYRVIGNQIKFEYGTWVHNSVLSCVKCSFQLGAFHCYDINPDLPTYCDLFLGNFNEQQLACLLSASIVISNSDDSFLVTTSVNYELADTTFLIYLDGVLSNTSIVPSMVAETLNITLT